MNTSDAESLSACLPAAAPAGTGEAWGAAEARRWEEFETKLSAQLTELARLCADDSDVPAPDQRPIFPLRQQARWLAQLHDELKAAQQRWRVQQDWREREHQALHQQLDAVQRQLTADRAALASQEATLDQREQKLDHALRFASQQQAEVDAQRLRLRAQRRRASATLAQRREELRRQLQEFHDALAASGGALPVPDSQIEAVVRERDELRQRLEQAEANAGAAGGSEKEENDKSYELRRRFEMAVEDMRAYKHRVEELEQQLAERPGKPAPAPNGGLRDWAQQKAQMLAALETDLPGTDQKSVDNRLTVEGAIRITDDVVAAKEAEIKQLQRQLEDLQTERKSAAMQDIAAAGILDHDAVIATERERLRKLQESSLEKQRTAEVEISVERARLARQRVELEDRMHALETDLARQQAASPRGNEPATAPSKSARGRWLARLGLSHDEAAD